MKLYAQPTTKRYFNQHNSTFRGYIEYDDIEKKDIDHAMSKDIKDNKFVLHYNEQFDCKIPSDVLLLASHLHSYHEYLPIVNGEFVVPYMDGNNTVQYEYPTPIPYEIILAKDILSLNKEKTLKDAKIIVWYNHIFTNCPSYDHSLIEWVKGIYNIVNTKGPLGWVKGTITLEEWINLE